MTKIIEVFDSHKLLLFFVPFLIYLSNGREISSGDPTPTVFTAVYIAKHGTIFLDTIHDYIPYHTMPYFISEQRGHIVSNYPIFPAIMATPLIAPFVWIGMIQPGDGDLVWKYLAELCGASFTALAGVFMYLTLKRLIDKTGAFILTFAFTLGTALWPIAAQSLWQHGPSVLWWSICFYALVRLEQSHSSKSFNAFLLLGGLTAGAAVLCRTVNGIGAVVLCCAVLYRYRLKSWLFIIPAAFLTLSLIGYNLYIFGSWKGGDIVLHSLHWELDRVSEDSWSTPLHIGLAGQLISPSRGIFIFSPFLIFAFVGMYTICRKNDVTWRLLAYSIPAPIIMLLVFSKYVVWWGGNSHFGPRYQIETYPFLMLYLAAFWPVIWNSKWLRGVFLAFLVYSIFIQWIGAFCYPGGWAVEPTSISNDHRRYWDWSYNQICTCLKSGIKFGRYGELFKMLK